MLDLVHRDQRVGVFLARLLDDLARSSPFHQTPVAQHHDLVGDLRHHGEVMGDVERGDMRVADGVLDRRQHVDLRGDVERRGRLVEDDQVGLGAQRHRRHDALELAAGDLVRIALADRVGIGQRQLPEQRPRPFLRFGARRHAMQQRGLDHLVHQLVRGVEGGRRRLRDVAHLAAAHGAHAALAELQEVAAVEEHLASGDAHPAAPVGHRRQADGRFAGARFADQAEYLARLEAQRDVVHQRDRLRRFARRIDLGLDLEVADVEQEVLPGRLAFGCSVRH